MSNRENCLLLMTFQHSKNELPEFSSKTVLMTEWRALCKEME